MAERQIVIPLANYPKGSRQTPSIAIPDDVNEIFFEFARCTDIDPSIWSNAIAKIYYDQEISFDGGVTWVAGGGFSSNGGILIGPDGNPMPLSWFVVPLAAGVNRFIRATVKIDGAPIKTQGAIEFRAVAAGVPLDSLFHQSVAYTGGTGNTYGGGVSSLETASWSFSGSNLYLAAGMTWRLNSPLTYTSMKWGGSGGTALTQIGSTFTSVNTRMAMAGLINPSTSSLTLYGQISGTAWFMSIGGAGYSGVHQTTPVGTLVTGIGTGVTASIAVPSESGGMVMDQAIGNVTTGLTVGAGQTELWNQIDIPNGISYGRSYEAGGASVTMSWALASQAWYMTGVPIKEAATTLSIWKSECVGSDGKLG